MSMHEDGQRATGRGPYHPYRKKVTGFDSSRVLLKNRVSSEIDDWRRPMVGTDVTSITYSDYYCHGEVLYKGGSFM